MLLTTAWLAGADVEKVPDPKASGSPAQMAPGGVQSQGSYCGGGSCCNSCCNDSCDCGNWFTRLRDRCCHHNDCCNDCCSHNDCCHQNNCCNNSCNNSCCESICDRFRRWRHDDCCNSCCQPSCNTCCQPTCHTCCQPTCNTCCQPTCNTCNTCNSCNTCHSYSYSCGSCCNSCNSCDCGPSFKDRVRGWFHKDCCDCCNSCNSCNSCGGCNGYGGGAVVPGGDKKPEVVPLPKGGSGTGSGEVLQKLPTGDVITPPAVAPGKETPF
jgi:hypothetical protein